MSAWIETALANAAIATVLAAIVLVITRAWRQPHVAHVLWLLVLVKLVTPPLVDVPIAWRGASIEPQARIAAPTTADFEIAQRVERSPLAPATDRVEAADLAALAGTSVDSFAEVATEHDIAAATPVAPTTSIASRLSQITWTTWLAAAWLVGSLAWILIATRRIVRFERLLARAEPFPPQLEALDADVASRLGLRRPPRLRIVDAQLPPLVWPIGRRPTVVLPRSVASGLDAEQFRAVLAHELAHVARRDHWVRWLELVVGALYWWHPVVWLARRELRAAEELCCDALVVARLATDPQTYGRALVNVVELLAAAQQPAPGLASSLGTGRRLEHRIKGLLADRLPAPLSKLSKLALVCVALVVLPLSATAGRDDVQQEDGPQPRDEAIIVLPLPAMAERDDAQQEEGLQPRDEAIASEDSDAADDEIIRPGMVVEIRVDGTPPEKPIEGEFLVQPNGTVALGPTYGRVEVSGLTFEEAEKAIEKHLSAILQNPAVQVTLPPGDAQAVRRHVVKLPPVTYKIAPGDLLHVEVEGALDNRPIDGEYLVEPSGMVGLGAPYGRVKVAGLTLEEAEKVIEAHLRQILTAPIVFVTLGGWRSALHETTPAGPGVAEPPEGKAALRFQGKSFDEWQHLLFTELDPSEQTQAIQALARFAGRGYGDEIAEMFAQYLLQARPADIRLDVMRTIMPTIRQSGTAGVRAFERIIESRSPFVTYAVHYLGQMGKTAESAVPVIVEFAKGQTGQGVAYEALGKVGVRSDDVISLLTAGLADEEITDEGIESRFAAALALSKLGTPAEAEPAVDVLIDLLRTEREPLGRDRNRRLEAVDALSEIGPAAAAAIPVLRELLDHPPKVALGGRGTEELLRKKFIDGVTAALESIEPHPRPTGAEIFYQRPAIR